ncbi:MAG: hypothetical protein ABI151_10640 [Chitinophagaceae bacterium]
MLAITINILWVPVIVLGSAIFGFMIKKAMLIKSQRRVMSLENEMLNDHAQILRLQKELATIEKARENRSSSTRVVPMKDSSNTDDSQKNVR